MRRLRLLLPLALLACGRTERIDYVLPPSMPNLPSSDTAVIVQDAGASLPTPDAGFQSALHVPIGCPVYAPGGGDVGTPEAPFPPELTAVCVVDDQGGSYGVVQGDAPTAQPAVLPGMRELGLYIGLAPNVTFSFDQRGTLDGPILSAVMTCCSPSRDVTLTPGLVAQNTTGFLVSLGQFDGGPQKVTFAVDVDGMLGAGAPLVESFYVNAAPP